MRRSLVFLFIVLAACTPKGEHRPVAGGGAPGNGKAASGGPSFDQLKPIFAARCAACHPSNSKPDWQQYSAAKDEALNGPLMDKIMVKRTMPLPGSEQALAITESERGMIAAWIQAGAPEHASADTAGSGTPPPVVSTGPAVQKSPTQACASCHDSATGKIPQLAGQNFDYLFDQLRSFYDGSRVDATMSDVASKMTPDELRTVAQEYSQRAASKNAKKDLSAEQRDLFARGESMASRTSLNCVSCHMPTRDHHLPELAGQNEEYLRRQLFAYRAHTRDNPLMNEYARTLGNGEIEALAFYFANAR